MSLWNSVSDGFGRRYKLLQKTAQRFTIYLSMRTVLFCLSLTTVLIASGCQPAAAPVAISNRPLAVNDKIYTDAPLPASRPLGEMSWTDQKERVQKVSDLKGKALILDFWATYCEPCRREIPHLNSLLAKYGKENLEIVGLNVGGEDDLPEIPGFLKKTKVDYPIAFPPIEFTACNIECFIYYGCNTPDALASGRIAVKAINRLWEEAMKVWVWSGVGGQWAVCHLGVIF